jgi:GT2 family glycosyltransferase
MAHEARARGGGLLTSPLPTCSVVIPTQRRPRLLGECLAALAELDYPKDRLAVIVVGDLGGVPIEEVATATDGRLAVDFVPCGALLPSRRRNVGAAKSSSEVVAFTDDDCKPTRGWLRQLVERHGADPLAAVGGHTHSTLTSNPYAVASQLIINIGYRQNGSEPNAARFFTTDNLLVSRAQFLELGGFDETFWTAEDREFSDRWLARGWPMRYEPAGIVHHAHPIGLRGFLIRNWHYGRGAQRFWRKRAGAGREPFRIDPDFYATVARAPFGRRSMRLRLAFLLLLWHLLNTGGFLYEAALARLGRSPLSVSPIPYSAEPLAEPGRAGAAESADGDSARPRERAGSK